MAAVKAMRSTEQEQLARLLLNPDQAVAALRRAAVENAPLSKPEQIFRRIAQAAGRTEASTAAGGELLRRALVGASDR